MTVAYLQYRGSNYPIDALPDDHITTYLRNLHRFYEIDLLSAIRRHERTGVYLDVGAHIGNHSVFFSQECAATDVIAFEPNPVALPALLRNAARYGFTVYPHAIHNSWDAVDVVDDTPGNHGMARTRPGGAVSAKRLDDLGLTNVAVIKIDVEGAELDVLRSGRQLIRSAQPIITAEAHTDDRRAELDSYLRPLGYAQDGGCYGFTPTYLWLPTS